MIKNLKPQERFIMLLEEGKFKKPGFIKLQQFRINKDYSNNDINKELENYKFFINSSSYDLIEKVKVKSYR